MDQFKSQTNRFGPTSFWLDLIGVFCVFFIYAGYSVPSVNEPHYWSKASHFWDSSFGKGDLFLESGDAHWLFFATFGVLTQLLPLPTAVWTGRFLVWLGLTWSWTILARSLWVRQNVQGDEKALCLNQQVMPLTGTFWSLVWLAGMHWGHWAGEWVVGGCESKGIAYAFIFLGMSMAIQKKWTLTWTFLGLASAFHVVTGVWVILCTVVVSYFLDCFPQTARQLGNSCSFAVRTRGWIQKNQFGWIICLVGVLVGALPALLIDWNASSSVATESALKQAYLRLGHHLVPTRFSPERWRWFSAELLIAFGLLFAMAFSQPSKEAQGTQSKNPSRRYLPNLFVSMAQNWCVCFTSLPRGIQFVVGCGMFAFAVAMAGLGVDLLLTASYPEIAAKILRFYWFRWNDVAMPMLIGVLVVAFASGWLQSRTHPVWSRSWAWCAILGPGFLLLGTRFEGAIHETIPAGDKAHLIVKTDSAEDQLKHYRDWLAVCLWIRDNTEKEGLWLTPRRQQSFKWHTERPELACWKDAPQNAVALVEWSSRLAKAYTYNERKILQPWTKQKLSELRTQYGIRYVLLDKRVLRQSPILLPMLYPGAANGNDTFAVYEFPDSAPALSSQTTTTP